MTLFQKLSVTSIALIGALSITQAAAEPEAERDLSGVRYGTEEVDGLDIFYREAGDPRKQAVVLLHGFPHSSHQYREVLDELGDEFYLIAPDYPGFGDSSFPAPRTEFDYTFDNLADVIDKFLIQRSVTDYVLMIHDYGAPVGFRIATRHPEKVKGLVVMNGNAYEEGISPEGWAPIMKYWDNPGDPEIEARITANVFSDEGLRWQYTHGTRNPEGINPDNWNLDIMKFARQGQHRMQLDLFYDYQNNLKLYPQWQQYLRDHQPPVLLVWGKNDAFFPVPGAEGYKRDVKHIEYHILDTGHFALEEEAKFITTRMRAFVRGLK